MYKCKLCNIENPENNHFYREHKITIKNYFETYENKRDLFDNSVIEFKGNIDDYFSKSFNSRFNLSRWIKKVSRKEYEDYVCSYLLERKNRKNLTYSLTQVELKTLLIPGIKWISENIKDYYQLCKDLGFVNRFQWYKKDMNNLIKLDKRRKIYVDTREKLLLEFKNVTSVIKKLDYGDYSFSDENWTKKTVIERKGISDLYGTLSGGYDRFINEIERAKNDNAYLVIVVESKFENIYIFPKMKHVYKKVTISPEFITHKIRQILEKYDHVQFVFIESHKKASELVEKIFSLGEVVQTIDLQYNIDINNL